IINFTSVSGLHGSPGQPNYAAAKMGIVGLTYSCANSLARYGVTVNAVSPAAATRMTDSVPAERRRARAAAPAHPPPATAAPVVRVPAPRARGVDRRPAHPLAGTRDRAVRPPGPGQPGQRPRPVGRRRARRPGGAGIRPDPRPEGLTRRHFPQ